MLPTIGFIIGIYTTIRLISMGTRDERGENKYVRWIAIPAAIFTIFLMIALNNASEEFKKQDAISRAEMNRLIPR